LKTFAVAIGILATIFIASLVGLLYVCKVKCKKTDLITSQLKDTRLVVVMFKTIYNKLPIQALFEGPSWLWSHGSWIYNYLCNQYLSPLMLWVRISIRERCTTLCHKICQWLATGWWFSKYYSWDIVQTGNEMWYG
jgi:hypothetical protein